MTAFRISVRSEIVKTEHGMIPFGFQTAQKNLCSSVWQFENFVTSCSAL